MNELAHYIDKYYAEKEQRNTSGKERVSSATLVLPTSGKREDKHHKSLVLINK